MEKTCQQSNSSVTPKMSRMFKSYMCILFVVMVILLAMSIRGIKRSHALGQLNDLLKQSVEYSQQCNTQLMAISEESIRIAQELKMPKEQQPANLQERMKLNAERNQELAKLIKQHEELLDTMRKIQEELGIVPKKESSESKAVLEKY
jgi:hypothetical protein